MKKLNVLISDQFINVDNTKYMVYLVLKALDDYDKPINYPTQDTIEARVTVYERAEIPSTAVFNKSVFLVKQETDNNEWRLAAILEGTFTYIPYPNVFAAWIKIRFLKFMMN